MLNPERPRSAFPGAAVRARTWAVRFGAGSRRSLRCACEAQHVAHLVRPFAQDIVEPVRATATHVAGQLPDCPMVWLEPGPQCELRVIEAARNVHELSLMPGPAGVDVGQAWRPVGHGPAPFSFQRGGDDCAASDGWPCVRRMTRPATGGQRPESAPSSHIPSAGRAGSRLESAKSVPCERSPGRSSA